MEKNPTEFSLRCSSPFATTLWRNSGHPHSVGGVLLSASYTPRVCACSPHSHDSVPLRHGSRALTCCERVGHPAPSEVSKWVCKEHGCFLNRPSNSASALHPPSHDPLTPQHSWDSAFQICLPPGFLHRRWCGDSSFCPQAFCFRDVAVTFPSVSQSCPLGSCLHAIPFPPPSRALRGSSDLLCSVGVQCYLPSVGFILLTHFPPALALGSSCLLNTQRGKC